MSDIAKTVAICQVNVPDSLKQYNNFVLWKLEQFDGDAKPRKVPYCPITGNRASTTSPLTWGSYEQAVSACEQGGYSGIGFVFSENDPFIFIDIDNCMTPDGASWNAAAMNAMQILPGAWEASQSGRGLHGVGRVADKAALTNLRNRWNDATGQAFEFYATNRFMAIGGTGWTGEIVDWSRCLYIIVPVRERTGETLPTEWKDEPRPDWEGPADDDELIRKAMGSRTWQQILGANVEFSALWHGSPELGEHWPDEGGRGRAFDHSAADLALCNALAWWTGCNPVRMARLFKKSALWRNDERKARLAIEKAIADPNRKYRMRRDRLNEDAAIGEGAGANNLPTVMTVQDAMRDIVFIADGSAIVHRPTKRLRRLQDARNDYAGSWHEYESGFDALGRPKIKRVPVINVWLADHGRLTVDAATWQPGQGEFCSVLERNQGGDRAYNLWTPPTWLQAPDNWEDWAKPFLQHTEYLVPIENEREQLLSWVAHIFQRPGELPHTHYLMVTEQTGTGRGTLAGILARALRGYVGINVDGDVLFGGFNGRISQKLLATVDEIREGNSANRYEKAEALKSKITEETRHINPKFGLQTVEKNCCRWLMFSNHMDALPFDNSDRRIIVIENPSTRAEPAWYALLHGLMDNPMFIASVQRWALSRDISGFNPFLPATVNTAKAKALKALESPLDAACRQFAAEWPDEIAALSDLAGFAECEAKSAALGHALERAGMRKGHRVKHNGQRETLLIVRGPLGPDDYRSADPATLSAKIIAARGKF